MTVDLLPVRPARVDRWPGWLGAALIVSLALCSGPARSASDGLGRTVTLPAPPQRIAALAPHLVEMLFALGVGDRIVATTDWADHPAAAASIPRVGNAFALSREVLAAQRPDLVLAWSGTLGNDGLAALERLGAPVWVSDPHDLADVADELESLAGLLGVDPAPAQAFRRRLRALDARAGQGAPLAVLPLVSVAPPLTVTDRSFVGDLLRHCNAFNPEGSGVAGPVLELSRERLLRTRARILLPTIEHPGPALASLSLPAGMQVLEIDPDLLVRPGPRVIAGAEQLCDRLEGLR